MLLRTGSERAAAWASGTQKGSTHYPRNTHPTKLCSLLSCLTVAVIWRPTKAFACLILNWYSSGCTYLSRFTPFTALTTVNKLEDGFKKNPTLLYPLYISQSWIASWFSLWLLTLQTAEIFLILTLNQPGCFIPAEHLTVLALQPGRWKQCWPFQVIHHKFSFLFSLYFLLVCLWFVLWCCFQ